MRNLPKTAKIFIKTKRGFTLVEMIVGAAVFAIIAISVFQGYSAFMQLVALGKYKIMATDIANAEFELIRNLPFAQVGLIDGIPVGVLTATTTLVRDSYTFDIVRTIRNIDDPFDGQLSEIPNDLSPADYKMVEIEVSCTACKNLEPLSVVGRVAPKNLETASTNGALFIRVFDANGVPVSGATASVTKSSNPAVSINDVTDSNGLLAIVDAPPGVNAYRISVTKNGYTTDRTHATSTGNPNPTTPDATVLIQQVTQVSFIIDHLSTLNIATKNNECSVLGDVPFTLTGSKLIGTNPNVLKFPNTNYSTDSLGTKLLSGLEWDTFTLSLNGGVYYLAGINPIMPISILPNSSQNIDIILTSDAPDHLLVTVKDNATLLPISGAELTLTKAGFSNDLFTGRGYLEQSDWSGGAGQSSFTDVTKYWSDDGNIETNSPTGELKLKNSLGHYSLSGTLTSSIFDTGTTSNFSNISWTPTGQSPEAGGESVKFQIATSEEGAPSSWDYLGPDGTAASFYTTSDTNVSPVHNGDRYFRYKVFLSTEDDNFTPNVASIAVTFTSECIPSGQAIFSGLSTDNYTLGVEKGGYASQSIPVDINSPWQFVDINLLPQ